jgi:undecaprenyl-diphosphatase
MPTPEEKAEARPVRRALKEAVKKVDSPAKADQVVAGLEAAAAGKTATEVQKTEAPPPTASAAAAEVQEAAHTTAGTQKTEAVIETTARALTTPDKHEREVVAQAAQEALNPEQQGAAPKVEDERERELLRKAVLKRLKPLDALDAQGFLLVNHLPHTRLLNRMFYGLTMAYSGGGAWFAAMGAAALQGPKLFLPLLHQAALPLALTGLLVELPIKWYFRRRRPFIKIIQAIVIGKKPGSWSFPSGHSAVAFGGAWLLNRWFPRWSPVTYTLASLVAFSRIYLGDHYPGDVLSGSMLGLLFARLFLRVVTLGKRR